MSSHVVTGARRPVWTWTDAVAAAKIAPLTKFVCVNTPPPERLVASRLRLQSRIGPPSGVTGELWG